jgi:hypothetical protein
MTGPAEVGMKGPAEALTTDRAEALMTGHAEVGTTGHAEALTTDRAVWWMKGQAIGGQFLVRCHRRYLGRRSHRPMVRFLCWR